jgi:hypothetical protein
MRLPRVRVEPHHNLYYSLMIGRDGKPIAQSTEKLTRGKGKSAFQTDVSLLETVGPHGLMPRVVFELKVRLSTHDVLLYGAKARKHKSVYPYLRYGLLVAELDELPEKFFKHMDGLDFCLALGRPTASSLRKELPPLTKSELECARTLEDLGTSRRKVKSFRFQVSTK